MRDTAPGVLEPPEDGWYDTGDIVTVDDAGFVTIRGRAKRFAKIGGEMVSMGAAEALAAALWPEAQHAVISLPDARKGKSLLLVTSRQNADAREMLAVARTRTIPEIMVPRAVLTVPSLPLLGTGKVDYPAVQRIADDAAAERRRRRFRRGVRQPVTGARSGDAGSAQGLFSP